MRVDKICISTNNSKLGIIPSIALPPGKSCRPKVPCAKSCYARRFMVRYPATRRAYNDNLDCLLQSPIEFFGAINKYLQCFAPRYFRVHVAGDFRISNDMQVNQDYLNAWFMVAANNPNTKFLTFTKCYNLDFSSCPGNFAVLWSAWINYPIPELSEGVRGIAWLQNAAGDETRIPSSYVTCNDKCDSCFLCWNLYQGQSVVFKLH